MYHIQEFMRDHIYEQPDGKNTIIPPIINPKFPESQNFSVPYCESYMMDHFKKRSTVTTKVGPLP